jgi:gliding motility-associated-like protein
MPLIGYICRKAACPAGPGREFEADCLIMRQKTTYLASWLFVLVAVLPLRLSATHIVGGEMTYVCLGNNEYRINLTIFRDCYYGVPWFDNPASIGVFNAGNLLYTQALVPLDLTQNDTLNPDLGSECFTVPPDVCVHTTSYSTIVTLPYDPGGYHIVYQRCCRNNTITNIVGPEDTGATYSIEISGEALSVCNSSPVFNNWPPLYICVNLPFQIDQSAVDPDGDSLVYRLCNPLQGASDLFPMPQPPNAPPYLPVQWIAPPYGVDNMLNGAPGGVPMNIHPVSGLLGGTPNTIGQFVIGICVEEYRGGILIGTNRRDYQVNVGTCGVAVAAFFSPAVICDGLSVSLDNTSTGAGNFLWFFNDPAQPGAVSNETNPTFTYSDTGTYTIQLVADPGTNCADTFASDVLLLPTSLFADFDIERSGCEDSVTVQISDSSLDTSSTIQSWEWTLQNGPFQQTSSDRNPVFVLDQAGSASLTLVVTAGNGCKDTLVQEFPVVILEDMAGPDSTLWCLGENGAAGVALNPAGGLPGVSYTWVPPDFLDDPTLPNPFASPDSTTTYTVLISDDGGNCQLEKTVTVLVSPVVSVTPVLDTILLGGTVQINTVGQSGYTYQWSPPEGLDDPALASPLASPSTRTVYRVLVTDEDSCTLERSVEIVVLTICEEPYLFIPTGFTPNGDGNNDFFRIYGNNLEEIHLVVYDRWGKMLFETADPAGPGWDGQYNGQPLPPDVYGFLAKVRCVGGGRYERQGNVTLLR